MINEIKVAEILCVGTELLLGDIVNTNAAHLSRELAGLGISVYHQTVVGDNPQRLKEAFSLALSRVDVVVVTGGLGPTCDDLTRETAAELMGRRLVFHPDILDEIRGYFVSRNRAMPENNRRQAMVPEGADVLHNDCGTAPGLWLEDAENRVIVMMPGVPSEMIDMFEKQVKPKLLARRHSALVSRNVHLFGIGESAAEEILRPMIDSAKNPTIAPYAKEGEVRFRVTAMADDSERATLMCDETVRQIAESGVGKYIYGIDVQSLENALVQELAHRGLTLACAESCTGGLVAKRIVDISGCSAVLLGGAVTYANEAKIRMLNVSPQTLDEYGAVSAETAAEMARGIRLALGADIGVSTTGIAGPGGGNDEKPVGTVYVGISTEKGESVEKLSLSPMRDRDFIRFVSASNALHAALLCAKSMK